MLRVVTGKPGSGKTYHVVQQLVADVLDWCRHEAKEGKEFGRRCFTNLPINREKFAAYVKEQGGFEFDPGWYVESLELSGDWWERLPDGALVIVDEVHEHMGREKDYSGVLERFRDYVATHRHRGHDLVMISQHIENVSIEILRIAEAIEEVQNLKAGRIPFFGIPIADVDVVRRAWGSETQVYRVSVGRVVGRSIKWGEAVSTHTIRSCYYGLYDSHNKNDGTSGAGDRPSLKLGRFESVRWFAGRHWFGLAVRIGVAAAIVAGMLTVMKGAPGFLKSAVRVKRPGGAVSGTVGSEKRLPGSELQPVGQPRPVGSGVGPAKGGQVAELAEVRRLREEVASAEARAAALAAEVEKLKAAKTVAGVFSSGVLLQDGTRVGVGEECELGGDTKERLEAVDAASGRVLWASGRETWVR